jgi:chloramphenicol 3-O phosphotransferase
MKPHVIFLNGTSSAGKTSIAKAIQELSHEPVLLMGIDTLYTMLPEKLVGSGPDAHKGYFFDMRDGMLERVKVGSHAQKLLQCTIPLVSLLLSSDNDLVIDEILFKGEGRDFLYQYAEAFAGVRAYFVKVFCPLEELERREVQRKNRHRGIARLQFEHVHAHGFEYDITVDTSTMETERCARFILEQVAQMPEPQSFAAIRAAAKKGRLE